MRIKLSPLNNLTQQPLQQLIQGRRSYREFSAAALPSNAVSRLLWAAQGRTGEDDRRSAPSAGAQYPIEVYAVLAGTQPYPSGLYRYHGDLHELAQINTSDLRQSLCDAALEQQPWVANATMIIVIAAYFSLMRDHFFDQPPAGERGDRYVFLEAGAIAQNVHLQATALSLAAVMVGGFDDRKVAETLDFNENIKPVALLCIGVNPNQAPSTE